MTIDVYRPITVLLDAVEFAAKKALGAEVRLSDPSPLSRAKVFDVDLLSSIATVWFPHIVRVTISRSQLDLYVNASAMCRCGSSFSLVPCDERSIIYAAMAPMEYVAGWLADGIRAHSCDEVRGR